MTTREVIDLARAICRSAMRDAFLRARHFLRSLGWPFDLVAAVLVGA
jgi:hypothetical protein